MRNKKLRRYLAFIIAIPFAVILAFIIATPFAVTLALAAVTIFRGF